MTVSNANSVNGDDPLNPIDEGVLKLLLNNHKQFQTFLKKRVSNDTIAEDLLQISLRKAIEHPPASIKNESILAWFYTILRNTLTDHYRSKSSEETKLNELKNESPPLTHEFQEMEDEICECLKGLIPALKPEYAELILQVDLEKKSPEAVANKLQISRGNLDVRLHRARQALKVSLERACGSCTEHGCLKCTCRK